MIIPINDFVLLKPFKQATEGIVEPETLEGAPEIGIVEAINKNTTEENIKYIGILQVGDKVFFDKFLATEVKDKGEKFYLVQYSDIKAIIKD